MARTHGERHFYRILAHLLQFHEVSGTELRNAKLVENDLTGSLVTGERCLAYWARSDVAREDMHRVGNWLSDVLRHQAAPSDKPPY